MIIELTNNCCSNYLPLNHKNTKVLTLMTINNSDGEVLLWQKSYLPDGGQLRMHIIILIATPLYRYTDDT